MYAGRMSVGHVGPAELSGPMVRAALDGDRREQFEAEFRAALAEVTHSFDVDKLAGVVRRWWVIAGGDQAVAEKDRDAAVRAARLADRNWDEPRPIYVPQVLVNRTGPAVRVALSGAELVEFETQFERALVEATSSFDHRRAARVVSRWWAAALTLANPNDLSQDRETARRLAAPDVERSNLPARR
jgi:hypothetical protein